MNKIHKLDQKDYKILREIDLNFRSSFSKIAKKVGLSKNSVALRFDKLKSLISHSTVGINNEALGYKLVKVYYTFNRYDNETEERIKRELKKHKNILWAARFYGAFDVSICILVEDLNELIDHVTDFNEHFSDQIKSKNIQIIYKQFFFRHNYLHEKPIKEFFVTEMVEKKSKLSANEKKILSIMRNDPRINIIDIAKKTGLSTKTITEKIKALEQNKLITGYFLTFNNSMLGFEMSKILIQMQKPDLSDKFEKYICSLTNVKHFRKMLGVWDYEIDVVNRNTDELHQQIEDMKQKFPDLFNDINIASFGKRIITNKESFLD